MSDQPGKRLTEKAADEVISFIEKRVNEKMGTILPFMLVIADENGVDILSNADEQELFWLIQTFANSQDEEIGDAMGEA